MLLQNKIAIVTGAGRGIGKAIALKLAEEGATVILAGRNLQTLQEVQTEINLKKGKADSCSCDVKNIQEIQNLIKYTIENYGKIDILINNAGISKEMPFLEMPIEVFDEIYEMNYRSALLMMKAVLPYMAERNSGSVINIGSGAAVRGLPGSSAYSASKAAVVSLTQSVGDEMYSKGVRINAICPGPVDTELFRKSERRDYILAAGGDLFQPEEIANAVVFLASDLSGCMNSQVLLMRGFNRW